MRQGNFSFSVTTVRWLGYASIVGLALLTMSGCSVYKASNQPDKKNMSVLSTGTPRGYVIAELGSPIWSGDKNGEKVDMFAFKQGYSKAAKVGRAFFHASADVLTAGLWEVVGLRLKQWQMARTQKWKSPTTQKSE